ncbi:MAG: T9SS type A sorting domain-containing protein [Ignavibacteria bacterium]
MKKLFVVLLMLVAVRANAQWVQVSNGMPLTNDISALVVSGNNILAGTYSGIFFSTNNGLSWNQTEIQGTIYCLAVSGNNVFAGGNGGGIIISTNYGINWAQTGLTEYGFESICINGNNIYAGSSGVGVYLSTNNGTNWSQAGLNNKIISSIVTSGNNIFAATWDSGVYKSTNNCISWNSTQLNNIGIQKLAVNGNNIFAGTNNLNEGSGVYLSTNEGINWNLTSLIHCRAYCFEFKDNNVFTFALTTPLSERGIYLSSNNGGNWLIKNQGFGNIPLVISLLAVNNYIFAGTSYNSIWRRSLSEIIGIQNISTETPLQFSLYQNYPNPFNPTTRIKYDVPSLSFPNVSIGNPVVLKVYDITGREIQTLVNERLLAGTYETTFDGSMLNSGVYFYKLTTDGFSESKRMILLK